MCVSEGRCTYTSSHLYTCISQVSTTIMYVHVHFPGRVVKGNGGPVYSMLYLRTHFLDQIINPTRRGGPYSWDDGRVGRLHVEIRTWWYNLTCIHNECLIPAPNIATSCLPSAARGLPEYNAQRSMYSPPSPCWSWIHICCYKYTCNELLDSRQGSRRGLFLFFWRFFYRGGRGARFCPPQQFICQPSNSARLRSNLFSPNESSKVLGRWMKRFTP